MTAPEPSWRSSRKQRAEIAIIGAVGYPVIRVLGQTWRWRAYGLEHMDAILDAGRQPVMAFWHGRILPALYYFRNRGIVVITSDNYDGEWIAKIIHRFGYSTVRGSTSRNAARAALKARRKMEEGFPVGVTVDGPRGPALVAQPGAVWLAKTTGNPILPFHLESVPHWSAPSWDGTQVPLPFAKVVLLLDPPRYIARDLDDEGLERERVALERGLLALKERAERIIREI